MSKATFQFFEDLNDFLVPWRKRKTFSYPFTGTPSIKHLIEALRVPHTEIGSIKVNGQFVDLSYLVKDGDQIEVYPIDIKNAITKNEITRDGKPRFLLDNHLGKLASYLRMMGFDVLYRNDFEDRELARIASHEDRILLTRDRGLLMRREILQGYCIRELDPQRQVLEVLERFQLFDKIQPFQRCLKCNGLLEPVPKEEILDRLEPLTRLYYDEFHICTSCHQIYWKGSHYLRMGKFLRIIQARKNPR